MRGVGLITEYNPFHNGHLYHVQQARRCSGADVVVAVMSGHFLQRGEPALTDKWSRAQMALRCGVDVVVELPLPYACNSAPTFARGAVQVLDLFAPHIESLCFGSESGDLNCLQQLARRMKDHDSSAAGTRHLRSGQTFPQARAAALQQSGCDSSLLDQPNNVLSVAYLRALQQLGSPLIPLTITRRGAGYNDFEPGADGIASATAIRQRLNNDNLEHEPVQPYMPAAAWTILQRQLSRRMVVDLSRWFAMVEQAVLGSDGCAEECYQMESGLKKRVFQAALTARDFEDLVTRVKARHLTRTRVQRLLCYLALGLGSASMDDFLRQPLPYIQLLGSSKKGELFLRQCRSDLTVPLVSNFSRIAAQLKRHYGCNSVGCQLAHWQLQSENRATRLYSLLLPGWQGQSRQWNYYQAPCRV